MKLKKLLVAVTSVLMLSAVVFTANAYSGTSAGSDDQTALSQTESSQKEKTEEIDSHEKEKEEATGSDENELNDTYSEEEPQEDITIVSDDDGIALTAADVDIEINEANFPDAAFRDYVKSFDTDNDGALSQEEIADVTSISLGDTQIESLDGIDHFTALESFLSGNNSLLKSIDLSGCTSLTEFSSVNNSSLEIIDLSDCTNLTTIVSFSNNSSLKILNLSGTGITYFSQGYFSNSIESIDLSNCESLTGSLYIPLNSSSNLESLKVNNCKNLSSITCISTSGYSNLKNLEVRNCTSLTYLAFFGNQLTSLDLTGSSEIPTASFYKEALVNGTTYSNIRSIELDDLDGDAFIKELEKYGFDISRASNWVGASYENGTLELSSSSVRYDYDCGNGNSFSPTVNISLKVVFDEEHFSDENFRRLLSDNLTEDEISKAQSVNINISSDIITISGYTYNPNYKSINITETLSSSGIKVIDGLKYFNDLQSIRCDYGDSSITKIDASGCSNLNYISLKYMTSLKELDASYCLKLDNLMCNNSALEKLNVSGSVNLKTYLYCENNNLTELDVTGLNKLTQIFCSGNNFVKLDLSGLTALEHFIGEYNYDLKEIYFNGCTSLKEISLDAAKSGNITDKTELTVIELKECESLLHLNLQSNSIRTIDLSDCTDLRYLNLYNNELERIDLTNLKYLGETKAYDSNVTQSTYSGGGLEVRFNHLIALNIDGTLLKNLNGSESGTQTYTIKDTIKDGDSFIQKLTDYDNGFEITHADTWQYKSDKTSSYTDLTYSGDINKMFEQIEYNDDPEIEIRYNYTYSSDTMQEWRPFVPIITFTFGGDLTVTNKVTGKNADQNKDFQFTVELDDNTINGTYGDMTFVNGVSEFKLKNGESKTADGLPANIAYTVTESDNAGYKVSSEGAEGTIPRTTAAQAIFTNEIETGNLTVSNEVTGKYADENKDFTFTVKLDDDTINDTYGDMTFISGEAAFKLKHGESKTAEDIPAVSYTVVQVEDPDYELVKTGDIGTIKADTTAAAAFTNTRKTGGLTVTNKVTGSGGDKTKEFSFTVELDTVINGDYDGMTFTNGKAAFKLKHSESKTFTELPANVGYTVEQTDETEYKVSSEGEKGTIEYGITASAAFTNDRSIGNLTVSNEVTGTDIDADKEFFFTVELGDTSVKIISLDGFNGTYGDMTFTDGKASFALTNGESVTATGLPAGVEYTVVQTEDTDYTLTKTTGDTGTIKDGETAVAEFTNEKNKIEAPAEEEPTPEEPTPEESTPNNPTTTAPRVPASSNQTGDTNYYEAEDVSHGAGAYYDNEFISEAAESDVKFMVIIPITVIFMIVIKKRSKVSK